VKALILGSEPTNFVASIDIKVTPHHSLTHDLPTHHSLTHHSLNNQFPKQRPLVLQHLDDVNHIASRYFQQVQCRDQRLQLRLALVATRIKCHGFIHRLVAPGYLDQAVLMHHRHRTNFDIGSHDEDFL